MFNEKYYHDTLYFLLLQVDVCSGASVLRVDVSVCRIRWEYICLRKRTTYQSVQRPREQRNMGFLTFYKVCVCALAYFHCFLNLYSPYTV